MKREQDERTALEKISSELQIELARELKARLSGTECKACGRSATTHQELTVIRQFLSDNGITMAATPRKLRQKGITERLPFTDREDDVFINEKLSA